MYVIRHPITDLTRERQIEIVSQVAGLLNLSKPSVRFVLGLPIMFCPVDKSITTIAEAKDIFEHCFDDNDDDDNWPVVLTAMESWIGLAKTIKELREVFDAMQEVASTGADRDSERVLLCKAVRKLAETTFSDCNPTEREDCLKELLELFDGDEDLDREEQIIEDLIQGLADDRVANASTVDDLITAYKSAPADSDAEEIAIAKLADHFAGQ